MSRAQITNVRAAEDFARRNMEELRSCQCRLCKKVLNRLDDHSGIQTKKEFVLGADAVRREHGWK